jgi:hypothetical protein
MRLALNPVTYGFHSANDYEACIALSRIIGLRFAPGVRTNANDARLLNPTLQSLSETRADIQRTICALSQDNHAQGELV